MTYKQDLRLCTRSDYEKVDLGEQFDEKSKEQDYSELCINDWSGHSIFENRKLTYYKDLRIFIEACDPKINNQCESDDVKIKNFV